MDKQAAVHGYRGDEECIRIYCDSGISHMCIAFKPSVRNDTGTVPSQADAEVKAKHRVSNDDEDPDASEFILYKIHFG